MGTHYNEGTHRAKIVSQGFPDANEYGQQFMIKIQILGHAESHERTVFLSLTDGDGQEAEWAGKTMDIIKYLGFHGEDASISRLDPDHMHHHSFVGIEVEVFCKHKTKTNEATGETKTFENWYINTPRSGGVAFGKPDPMSLKKLDSLFGKELSEAPPTTIQDSPPPKVKPVDVTDIDAVNAELDSTEKGSPIPF